MNQSSDTETPNLTEQSQNFTKAARALGCDESEAAFNAALGKIARHKPVSDPASAIAKPPKPAKAKVSK